MPVFPANFNVTSLNGVSSFSITGFPASSVGGWSVSGAGDINGDGIADLVVGAPDASSSAGASYIIFGEPSLLMLTKNSLSIQEGVSSNAK